MFIDNSITVVILTLNEAINLPRCLSAIDSVDSIVVLDSGSTDETCQIAQTAGVRVLHHPFQSFGHQRNWALDHHEIQTEWVLFLDADEEATPVFWQHLRRLIEADKESKIAGVFCCWKMILRGKWLKRSDNFPKWQMRLVRRKRMRFIDAGHGQKEGSIDGDVSYLKEPYLHHAFSKGWTDWLTRHNRYSSQEAITRSNKVPGTWIDAFKSCPSERNRKLKPLVSHLPFWPAIRFTHAYFLRGGFLEGREGLDYCFLMAVYEYLIRLKIRDQNKSP